MIILKIILQNIIDENTFKHDYEYITESLLFEKVEYIIAIKVIQKIIDSGLLD